MPLTSRGLLLLMMVLCLGTTWGCKEDPVGNNEQPPGPPRNFTAAEANRADPYADLQWNAPEDSTGITGYRIWWQGVVTQSLDSVDVAASVRTHSLAVPPIQGVMFSIAALRGTLMSTKVSIQLGGIDLPSPPLALSVTFTNPTTAHLMWTPSPDADIDNYLLLWSDADGQRSSQVDIDKSLTAYDLTTLNSSDSLVFHLYARRRFKLSSPVRATWDAAPAGVTTPNGFRVVSSTASEVLLSWQPAPDPGAITYKVSWETTPVSSDSGSVEGIGITAYTVMNLHPGVSYTFSVQTMRGAEISEPVSLHWILADRYTTEPGTSTPIRIYESASSKGAGLRLDPPQGPKNVSIGSSNPSPESVQLAIYTSSTSPNTFQIGPAAAFSEYQHASMFDQNVYISDASYPVTSLDTWISVADITQRITANGNIAIFQFPVTQVVNGQGFYVRTGPAGNYHYARVLIKNVAGKLLQGSAPDRFVELEISYQPVPNHPFASHTGGEATSGTTSSRARR